MHLIPGSLLVWTQEGDRIFVDRAKRHNTQEVHQALFSDDPLSDASATKTLAELKQGIGKRMRQRHAGR